MEENSPEKSSRIERRGRNARHKETPYARKQKKNQKNEPVIENGSQNKGLLGFAFGKVMTFVSSVINFTTYTPRENDVVDSESSDDEQIEVRKEVKPVVTTNEDSIADAIKSNPKGITQSEYQFYLELLRQKRTEQEEPKKEEKFQNESTVPTQQTSTPTSNVLRPQAIHPPNATTVDILRPFMQRGGKTNLSMNQSPSTTTSQLQARSSLKRPISPPKSTNTTQNTTILKSSKEQEGELYLTTQPPAKRQYREGSLGVSETAKRILDALDQFSSPVTEVKTPTFLNVGQNRGLTSARSLNTSSQTSLTPRDKIERTQIKTPMTTKPPVSVQEIPPSQSLSSVAPLTSAKKPKVTPKQTITPTPEREIVEVDDAESIQLTRKEKKVDITKKTLAKSTESTETSRELESENQLQEQLKKVPAFPTETRISFAFTPKPVEKTVPVDDNKQEEKKQEDSFMFFKETPKENKKKRIVEEIDEDKEIVISTPTFKAAAPFAIEAPKETPKEAPKEAPALPAFPSFPTFPTVKTTPKVDIVSSWKPPKVENKFAALAEEEPQEVFAPGADSGDSGSEIDSDSDSEKKSKKGKESKFEFNFSTKEQPLIFNTSLPSTETKIVFGATPTFNFTPMASEKKDDASKEPAKTLTFTDFGKKDNEVETPKPTSLFFSETSEKEKPKEEKKDQQIKFTFSAAPAAASSFTFGEQKKEESKKEEPKEIFGAPKTTETPTAFNFASTPVSDTKETPLLSTSSFSNNTSDFVFTASTPTTTFPSTTSTTTFPPTTSFGTSSSESNSGFTFTATPSTTSTPFSATSSTTPSFAFGTSTPSTGSDFVFGGNSSAPTSTFGTSSSTTGMDASPFKGFGNTSTSTPFGNTTSSSSTPSFGNTFGNAPFGNNTFGNTSTSMTNDVSFTSPSTPNTFGTSTSTPSTFGSSTFGSTSSTSSSFNGFGAPSFGSTTSTGFGGFGSSSATPSTGSDFVFSGNSSVPTSTFGTSSSTTPFGTSSTTSTAPFGATSFSGFSGNSSLSTPSTFGFGNTTTPAPFGAPTPAAPGFSGFDASSSFGGVESTFGGGGGSGFNIGASGNDKGGRKKLKAKRMNKNA